MRPPPRLAGLCLVSFLALRAAAQGPASLSEVPPDPGASPPPATEDVEKGYPVTLDGRTLYRVRASFGPFSAKERAEAAERRLVHLADDPFYSEALFTLEDADTTTKILYAGSVVGLVGDEDAAGSGLSRRDAAAALIRTNIEAIRGYREARQPAARIRGWVVFVVSAALLAAFLRAAAWAYRRLLVRIESRKGGPLTRWLRSYLGVRDDHVLEVFRVAARVGRLVVTLLAVVVFLEVAFVAFPITRGFALAVLDYVLEPVRNLWQGFLRNIGGLFTIAVIVTLTRYLLRFLKWLLGQAAAGVVTLPGITREWAMPFYNIARLIVLATAAVMIYPYIPGSSSLAFKGISIFAGALFTLGASGTAGNFIGGLVVIFAGSFRLGDWIKVGDVTGEVVETSLVLTKLRTARNEIVALPNATILGGQLVNYSEIGRTDGLLLRTGVTIGYDAPWRTVHELLLRAADRTSHLEKQPRPFVLQTALNDFYVTYDLFAYTREEKRMFLTYGELHANIQDAFNEGGVEIMSPHYTSLRDGNAVTIPESRRPAGYEPPEFRVRLARRDDEGSASGA